MKEIVFSEAHLESVSDFSCGGDSWAVPINEWIKNGDAIRALKKGKCRIWLYHNDNDEQIGYGSLGITNWPVIFRDDPKKSVLILPNLGVRHEHQKKGYGKVICGHLIHEAQKEFESNFRKGKKIAPILGLLVHPDNHGAKSLYRSMGFSSYDYFHDDREDDIRYEGMAKLLDVPAVAKGSPGQVGDD
ncbi:MAG: hypothetical protein NVSMB9_22920 [Isosphaeraceae bacterium]